MRSRWHRHRPLRVWVPVSTNVVLVVVAAVASDGAAVALAAIAAVVTIATVALHVRAAAADQVILTAERIVETEELARTPDRTGITDLTVAAVVEAPGGARPGDCPGHYDVDEDAIRRYLDAARTSEGLAAYLDAER